VHVEFYLQETPKKFDKVGASFVGELFLPWKHCLEPDNIDKWSPEFGTNNFFRDEKSRVTDVDGLTQGSSCFIKTKWVPVGSDKSDF
jgi:hypothetical protein